MARPHRRAPEPLTVDAVSVVAVGTGLWLLALIVTLAVVGPLRESGHLIWLWTALAGSLLGLLGLRLTLAARRHDRRSRGIGD